MKNVSHHYGELRILRRLPSSRNGNPRFLVMVDGYVCRTAVDSNMGYAVKNMDGKRVEAYIGTHYGVRTLDRAWILGEKK